MRNQLPMVMLILLLTLTSCGDSGSNVSQQTSGSPGTAVETADNTAVAAYSETEDSPYVLGFRWSGPLGTAFRVRLYTRDQNYEIMKAQGTRP